MQMSLNVKTPEMLVFSILEEVLKLKRVIGGVGMVFYHGLQESSWGEEGQKKILILELHRVGGFQNMKGKIL